MRTVAQSWRLLLLAAVCAASGCDTGVATSDLYSSQVDADVVFAEDADSAIASLPFVESELLVQPYPGANPKALAEVYSRVGAVVIDEIADIDLAVLAVPAGRLRGTAEALAESGLIETVQKNYLYEPDALPNDPLFDRQTHLEQVDAATAWDTTIGSTDVVIAIVDTGVYANHPDLRDKIIEGWNVYDDNADFDDVLGHGTQVAGVAAADSDNGEGVSGLSWKSPILVVRAGDRRGMSTGRHIAAGILWAASHGAKVINVSFAPLWSDRVVRAAAQVAFGRGCFVVISAGNGGGVTRATGYTEALFVGAVNDVGEIASFSDRGPFVDLVAPGTGIRSTTMDGDYGMTNGTSFSAPIVSGVAALVWSVSPDLRPASIRQILLGSAVDLGEAGRDSVYGHGAVDAAAAVREALAFALAPDSKPPSLDVVRPINGEALTGPYLATATATDTSGVADVALSIDGIALATDVRSPYRFVIDTAAFDEGRHELSFVATDSVGNVSLTETVVVTFAPSTSGGRGGGEITFTSPAADSTVSGTVIIQASVADADGLSVIEWFVDGESVFVTSLTGLSSGVTYAWSSSSATPGPHTITITITDTRGRRTTGSIRLIAP